MSPSSIRAWAPQRRPIAIRTARGDVLDRAGQRPARPGRAERSAASRRPMSSTNRVLWLPVIDVDVPRPRHLRAGRGPPREWGRRSRTSDRRSTRASSWTPRAGGRRSSTARSRRPSLTSTASATSASRAAPDRAGGRVRAARARAPRCGHVRGGEPSPRHPARDTFGAVATGASLRVRGLARQLAMADNQGNLAARLGIGPDRPVRIMRGLSVARPFITFLTDFGPTPRRPSAVA